MHTCIMYARKHGLWFFTHLLCTNCWVTLWYAPVDILLLLCHLTSRQRKCIHVICLCMSCGSHSQFSAVHFQLRTVRKIDSWCHNQNRCIFPAGKSGLTVVPMCHDVASPPPSLDAFWHRHWMHHLQFMIWSNISVLYGAGPCLHGFGMGSPISLIWPCLLVSVVMTAWRYLSALSTKPSCLCLHLKVR